MKPRNSLRPSRALARRFVWGAAIALCCATAQAQNLDSNTIAVAFSGGDTFGAPGVVNNIRLDVEVTDDPIVENADFRSMSLVVDVDCRGDRERLRKAEAFDQPNLAGTPRPRGVSGEWAPPEAYMREVIKTICTVHGMRVVEHDAGPVMARAAAPPAEPPRPRPPAAPASPPPSPPELAVSSAPSLATNLEHEPYPASPNMVAPPPSAPPSPAAAAGFLSQPRVQIASSPSRADAQAKLDRSAALIASPLRGEVEVATVHGKTVYRSIIAPFGSEAAAQAFCARARPNLDGCFVWPAR